MRSRGRSLAGRVAALSLVVASAGCAGVETSDEIRVSGHVEATHVRVSAEVGGRVLELLVDEGDDVEAGQLLARLDTRDTELALEAARAELRLARAERDLRVAGAREEDVAAARAEVARASAALEGAERDLERMEGLLAAGSGTTKARDDARVHRDVAAATLDAAREGLRRLERGFRAEEIDAARARVAAAEAGIAQLEKALDDAVVESPVAGVVTEKLTERGELLSRGAGVAVVTRLDAPWLTVYVAEPDLDDVRLGQEVEVVTDGGARRNGTVTFVASRAEFTPKNVQTRDERVKLVFRLKVGLPNDDGLFKPGMPAEARLRRAGGAS